MLCYFWVTKSSYNEEEEIQAEEKSNGSFRQVIRSTRGLSSATGGIVIRDVVGISSDLEHGAVEVAKIVVIDEQPVGRPAPHLLTILDVQT
jgi:hypothetical protein